MPIYECLYRSSYGDDVDFEIDAGSLRNAALEAKRRLGCREFVIVQIYPRARGRGG